MDFLLSSVKVDFLFSYNKKIFTTWVLQVGRVKSIGTKCRKPSHLSFTHLSCPSSLGLIHSSNSFWNHFSVIAQHFREISVVIFLHDLALLLHAFCFPFSAVLSHLFKILSYEISFFLSLGNPRAAHPSPSRWIGLQEKKEHIGQTQLQEEPRSHLHARSVGLHCRGQCWIRTRLCM